jgi:CHAD domain-containing protein
LAEIDDDEVSALEDDRIALRFREIEVELADEVPPGVLERLVARLQEAGAGAPDPTPKLARVLGPRALRPPDLVPIELGKRSTIGDVVAASITAAAIRIIDHHPTVILDEDPEGVHQARVGTRRLRSDLRTLRPLVDDAAAGARRNELSWLADLLGAVRDADVLRARLERQAVALGKADEPGVRALLDRLADERERARDALVAGLEDRRYAALLDAVVTDGRLPPVVHDVDSRARGTLEQLVRRPWRRLCKEVDALQDEPSDDALHTVRIRAKRARYAVELAAPVVGRGAVPLGAALADLQDVLGDLHDAAVAAAWLRAAVEADPTDAAQGLAAGQLIAVQEAEAERLRAAWSKRWKKVVRRARRVRWLR